MNFNNINFNQTQRRLTEEEKKEIIQVFEMFDIDKDNYLDIYQFGVSKLLLLLLLLLLLFCLINLLYIFIPIIFN
ncbi:hypothetical protein K502DRAFT_152361 [Neoconidiobolus thromboides FSU 785]|nr:hypothetical protein K502DRAFT_152361 [Neoconidiobolus thromboides FSU 785]